MSEKGVSNLRTVLVLDSCNRDQSSSIARPMIPSRMFTGGSCVSSSLVMTEGKKVYYVFQNKDCIYCLSSIIWYKLLNPTLLSFHLLLSLLFRNLPGSLPSDSQEFERNQSHSHLHSYFHSFSFARVTGFNCT